MRRSDVKAVVIVEKGDTLSHIAERFLGRALAWPVLARLNQLRNPHLIFPGQVIQLP